MLVFTERLGIRHHKVWQAGFNLCFLLVIVGLIFGVLASSFTSYATEQAPMTVYINRDAFLVGGNINVNFSWLKVSEASYYTLEFTDRTGVMLTYRVEKGETSYQMAIPDAGRYTYQIKGYSSTDQLVSASLLKAFEVFEDSDFYKSPYGYYYPANALNRNNKNAWWFSDEELANSDAIVSAAMLFSNLEYKEISPKVIYDLNKFIVSRGNVVASQKGERFMMPFWTQFVPEGITLSEVVSLPSDLDLLKLKLRQLLLSNPKGFLVRVVDDTTILNSSFQTLYIRTYFGGSFIVADGIDVNGGYLPLSDTQFTSSDSMTKLSDNDVDNVLLHMTKAYLYHITP